MTLAFFKNNGSNLNYLLLSVFISLAAYILPSSAHLPRTPSPWAAAFAGSRRTAIRNPPEKADFCSGSIREKHPVTFSVDPGDHLFP
jgi:hypothetical protein